MKLLGLGIFLGSYLAVLLISQNSQKCKRKLPEKEDNLLSDSQCQTAEVQSKHYLLANTGALVLSTIPGLSAASLPLTAYGSHSLVNQGFKTISKQQIKNDLLNATIVIASVVTGHYFIAAFYAWINTIGDLIVSRTKSRSQRMLTEVFNIQPKHVWILRQGVELEIPVNQVHQGEIVVVRSGEIVPVDGILVQGEALVDAHILTGEFVPVEKQAGDQVLASTLVVSGQFSMRVEHAGKETVAGKLGEILKQTSEYKSDVQIKGEYYADWAAKPALLGGLISVPFLGAMPALTIISSSPGNSVRTLCSLQTLTSLIYASRRGIFIKDGRALENLINIDTFVFDKTGTLTKDEPKVGNICVLRSDLNKLDVLARACVAERKVDHPIARAIISAAKEQDLTVPIAHDSAYRMGYGITVRTTVGELIQVGSTRFISSEGLAINEQAHTFIEYAHSHGYSVVLVAIDGQVAGIIELIPCLRPEMQNTLKSLRQNLKNLKPIQFYIISGDHQNPTKKLAEELAMDGYYFEILPEEKAEIIKKLQRKGRRVCFIGDGINDIVAMRQADVSISMHGASTIATDTAQIVLMDGDMTHLPNLVKLAYRLDKDLKDTLGVTSIAASSLVTTAVVFHTSVVFTGIVMGVVLTWGFRRAFVQLNESK